MSFIVSRLFILLTEYAKEKRFTVQYCCQKSTKKDKTHTFLELKCRNVPCVCDNLVHILLHLGTFHAHYTNHKIKEDFLKLRCISLQAAPSSCRGQPAHFTKESNSTNLLSSLFSSFFFCPLVFCCCAISCVFYTK